VGRHRADALALAVVVAGCAPASLPYFPAEQPAGMTISAGYERRDDRLRVSVASEGYRVEEVSLVRPDGSLVPAERLEATPTGGGHGVQVGLGMGGGWSSGGGVDVGSGVGVSLGPRGSAPYTVAVFPLADAGPGPWRLRVKVAGVPPVEIPLGPPRRP
jgi:hypothetical protein